MTKRRLRPRVAFGSRRVIIAIAAALTLFLLAEDALARGFGRGGFSARSFSSRSFSSRSSRSLGGARSSRSLSGSRASTASARSNTSGVSQSRYNTARANGTTYQNRSQATSAFRTRNSSQYPSKFSSQPTARPSHIPQSTRVNGQNYNVSYNRGLGGYGYSVGGRWILYSAMADVAMMSVLMNNRGYYYGARPGAYVGGRSSGFWTGLMVIGIFLAIYFVVRSSNRSRYYDN
jgi:hypothetical protein